jgi:hypothetical protein
MTIDIARYISKVEAHMGEMIDRATAEGGEEGTVLDTHQKNILLPGVFKL